MGCSGLAETEIVVFWSAYSNGYTRAVGDEPSGLTLLSSRLHTEPQPTTQPYTKVPV